VAGVLSSAVTGFLCIRYFMRYLQTRSMLPFVLYRAVVGVGVLVLIYTGRLSA